MIGGPYGKRPTAMLGALIHRVEAVCPTNADAVRIQLNEILSGHRYVGDIKALAEKYGLHYLKSKKMRRRELVAWIVDNHPVILGVRKMDSERKDGV